MVASILDLGGTDLQMDSPIPKDPCFLSCRTPWQSLTSWRDCGHSFVLTKKQLFSWTRLSAFFYLHLASMNRHLTLPIGHWPVIIASFYSQDPQWSCCLLFSFCVHTPLLSCSWTPRLKLSFRVLMQEGSKKAEVGFSVESRFVAFPFSVTWILPSLLSSTFQDSSKMASERKQRMKCVLR